ncbi:MAG: hypothetical protein ABSF44_06705 [Candidatus Bathyarchaeia archaeon]
MNLDLFWLLLVLAAIAILVFRHLKLKTKKFASNSSQKEDSNAIISQLSMLEERTKQLGGLEEKIEKIRDRQDSESKELRERLYDEYSKRLQESIELLKETYAKMNSTTSGAFREIANQSAEVAKQINVTTADAFRQMTDHNVEVYKQTGASTINALKEITSRNTDALQQTAAQMNMSTSNAFKEITNRNLEVYKQTAAQLSNMIFKLEGAFKVLEEREHTQMRCEIEELRHKVTELERDPLKVQLEELSEARNAQAVHEQSVRKITTIFWPNNGEVKFNEKVGQYVPDVLITNHKLKIVADEVTTEEVVSLKEKVKKVAEYMRGLNANVGYVIIPNAGIEVEVLREIKRTVAERGLYVVRITEFAVHLQVWYDVSTTGIIDFGSLVERGRNFLQILEPIFEEFTAIMQNLEQRDERDFKYRQNRYKEIKFYPGKILNALEKVPKELE